MQAESREEQFQKGIQWQSRLKGKLYEAIIEHIIILKNLILIEFNFSGVGLDAARWRHQTSDDVYVW